MAIWDKWVDQVWDEADKHEKSGVMVLVTIGIIALLVMLPLYMMFSDLLKPKTSLPIEECCIMENISLYHVSASSSVVFIRSVGISIFIGKHKSS